MIADPQPLRSIVIVGTGCAAWMAAAFFSHILRRNRTQITLIEDPDLETIGVGEATTQSLVGFVRALGLDEAELMRRCSGTYNLGTRYDDWIAPGHVLWNMLGPCGTRPAGHDLFHFWLHQKRTGAETRDYSDFSLHALLAATEKSPRPVQGSTSLIANGDYGFHLDAAAFSQFLREVAAQGGVRHLFGEVGRVLRHENGSIASLDIGGGRVVDADFFFDCNGVLAEHHLDDRWIDWSGQLLCDRAVVLPLPSGVDLEPCTRITAREAGWMWRIPLSNRVGMGYVHSSRFVDEDRAAAELIRHSDLRRVRTADPRFYDIRMGRRSAFWNHNCVALGRASGNVEPLGSTGLHMVVRALENFVSLLPDRRNDEVLRTAYNRGMSQIYDDVRDFLVLHYLLSRRHEAFWHETRDIEIPQSLSDRLALYYENGHIVTQPWAMFSDTNYYFLLSGAGRLPRRFAACAELAPVQELRKILDGVIRSNAAFVEQMPTHAQAIAALQPARLKA
jgi:tryptophan halogenase